MNRLLTLCIIVALLPTITLATKYIPDGSGDPDWDPVNRIYTLSSDVYETIEIVEDNLTLDGAGHTVKGEGSNPGNGIELDGMTGVTIKNITVQNFYNGILLENNPNGNTVTNNTIKLNTFGIFLQNSNWNEITDNTVSNNNYGIALIMYSDDNTLTGNMVSDNNVGVYLQSESSNNKIYNNNFIGNTTQAEDNSGSGNTFDFEGSGNYWNDYIGVDDGSEYPVGIPRVAGDGIGDTDLPHLGLDSYPWIVQDGWLTPELLIARLIAKVEELNLQNGINNSLDAKLQNALDALEAKNAGQRQDAINKMQAFVNAVEAQSGDKIPVEAADDLIVDANYIISLL